MIILVKLEGAHASCLSLRGYTQSTYSCHLEVVIDQFEKSI